MYKVLLSVLLTLTLLYAQTAQTVNSEQDKEIEEVKQEAPIQPQVDEKAIVRTIIENIGMNDVSVKDIAKMEEGRVVYLDLSNRDFSKDGISLIPPEIGQLTSLKTILCKENVITEIPAAIGKLESLQKLVATSNRINSISPEIGKCTSLVDLDLRHNQIENLPPETGNLKNLVYLRLWGNRLTSLPETIGNLKSLNELYLKDNRLENLPSSLTKLKLEYVDIIGNKLCNLKPEIEAWVLKIDKKYKHTQKCW